MTDVLDEEAEVEDPAEDLDDPGEESESDCLVGAATRVVEGHHGINSGRPNSGLPAKQGCVYVPNPMSAKPSEATETSDLY